MKKKKEHLPERGREREGGSERDIKKEKKTRKVRIKEIGSGKVKNQPCQGDSEQEKYGRRASWIILSLSSYKNLMTGRAKPK